MADMLCIKGSDFLFQGFEGMTGTVTLSAMSDRIVIYPQKLEPASFHFYLEVGKEPFSSPDAADFVRIFFDLGNQDDIELTFNKFPGTGNYLSIRKRERKETS